MVLSIVGILINMVGSWFIIQTQEQPDIVEVWLKPFLFGCGLLVVGSVLFIFNARKKKQIKTDKTVSF